MPWLILYLVKCSLSLACLYLFYLLVLRPLTFYHWNRLYLLIYSLLSFFLPFIDVTPLVAREGYEQNLLVNAIPSIHTITSVETTVTANEPASAISFPDIILMVFISGLIFMVLRFLMQWVSLQRVKRSAAIIQQGDIWLYDVSLPIHPFSFGKDIFINSSRHTDDELKKIIQHEFVHVKQQHSIDLIAAELLCILNWYNPFAWLIRKAIRDNLEFIADNHVLQSGTDAQQYQRLLLKVVGLPQYSITNHFSFSSLKKRIIMMNKLRSARLHLVKFLFLVPLCAVILLAFRNRQIESRMKEKGEMKRDEAVIDLTQGKPSADVKVNVAPRLTTSGSDKDGAIHFTRPVSWSIHSNDTVPPAADTGEGIESTLKQLPGIMVDKTGQLAVKGNVQKVFVDGKEYFLIEGSNGQKRLVADTNPKPPVPPVPVTKSLPEGVKSISRSDNQVTVTYKNGKVERYNLEVEREKGEFEERFGAYVPPAPVPPIPAGAPTSKPVPPAAVNSASAPKPPVSPAPAAPATPAPLPPGVASMHVNNNRITIKLKDGKEENYDMNNADQKAAYYRKYGKFPSVPQAPAIPQVPPVPATSPVPPVKAETNGVEQVSRGTYILREERLNEILAEGRKRGEIFIGIVNPLDINIDHVRTEDMVIEFGNGTIRKVNGLFYALPAKQGMSKLIIFKKEKDGTRTHLKTIDVNVKRLPDPSKLNKGSIVPANRSFDLWPLGSPWMPVKDNC